MCKWSTEHSCSELSLQPACSPWHPTSSVVMKGVCIVIVMFFDIWICWLSQRSIASISLWFSYIERVGLKLPNNKSHKPACPEQFAMCKEEFYCVVFMKTLRFVRQWSMAVVCRFHDISIHVYSKKSFDGIVLLFFFHRQIGTKTPKFKIFRYMYIPERVLMVASVFVFHRQLGV